eukprot:1160642-Pelagomonas_calceolata.AAC.12
MLLTGSLTPAQLIIMEHLSEARRVFRDDAIKHQNLRMMSCLNAAISGNTNRLQAYMGRGRDVSATDYDNRSALMLACRNNHEVRASVCALEARECKSAAALRKGVGVQSALICMQGQPKQIEYESYFPCADRNPSVCGTYSNGTLMALTLLCSFHPHAATDNTCAMHYACRVMLLTPAMRLTPAKKCRLPLLETRGTLFPSSLQLLLLAGLTHTGVHRVLFYKSGSCTFQLVVRLCTGRCGDAPESWR